MEFFEIAKIVEVAFMSDVYKRYLWAYLVIAGAIFAVLYILQSVALYTIAKREGFKNRWMSFVPFFNTYYIGVVSEKNKVFKTQAKNVALAAALVEVAYVALGILYYVATYLIFKGGYAQPEYGTEIVTVSGSFEVLVGYNLQNVPQNLAWAGWVFAYINEYVMYWVQLAFMVMYVFVLVSFFRTYSSPRYVLFSVLSVIFPIKGIFMFVVRNNKGKNYVDYLREQQQRQYRMYQEYMRGGMNGDGNGVNYGGYAGDPYANPRQSNPPEDPFGGLGSDEKKNGGNDDPFDGLGGK